MFILYILYWYSFCPPESTPIMDHVFVDQQRSLPRKHLGRRNRSYRFSTPKKEQKKPGFWNNPGRGTAKVAVTQDLGQPLNPNGSRIRHSHNFGPTGKLHIHKTR